MAEAQAPEAPQNPSSQHSMCITLEMTLPFQPVDRATIMFSLGGRRPLIELSEFQDIEALLFQGFLEGLGIPAFSS
jgi:hypothetical protein